MSESANLSKLIRFAWRTSRNVVCLVPMGRRILFPPQELAARFGPADVAYGVKVFEHHWQRLAAAGFDHAGSVLEVGPGRNLITALLLWSALAGRPNRPKVQIHLWDVFGNMTVSDEEFRIAATALLDGVGAGRWDLATLSPHIAPMLRDISRQELSPNIEYSVCNIDSFFGDHSLKFDLIYSHAAIEHVWHISKFWEKLVSASASGGWQSHRIDLADHGRRDSNYVEMLMYSSPAYWLMQRYTPGATNRWRASEHVRYIADLGMTMLSVESTKSDALPIPTAALAAEFRHLSHDDLRTVAVDIVARKIQSHQ